MRSDGTGRRVVGRKLSTDGSPSWSPDGRRLAFSRDGIFTIGVDGRGLTRLTWETAGYDDRDPAWSPNGATIAFARIHVRYPYPWGRIVLLDLTSRSERTFSDGSAQWEYDPDWSPDGRGIALTGEHESCCPTPIIARARSAGRDISFGGWENESWDPTWSPDGRRIAFVKERGIYIAPASGGRAVRASWSRPPDTDPAWQPLPARRLAAARAADRTLRYLAGSCAWTACAGPAGRPIAPSPQIEHKRRGGL